MADHAVVHFEIGGPDAKALQDFYAKLFDWTINADNPMNYGMVLKMDNGIGGGIVQPQMGPSSGFITVYVSCGNDLGSVLAKAEELRGTKVFGPMDVGGGGPTIAAFQDPDGNMLGLVSGSSTEAPPMTGGGAPVTWFEIAGTDAAKTQDFYRKLFDWEINADNPMQYGETPHIGNGIGGGIFGGMGDPRVTIYVEVPDLEETLATCGELGGTTVMEPDQVPGGPKIAMLTDVGGNVIGLLLAGSSGAN
jgi:predicted enzyme related to lactoylglutathione lyase